MRKIFIILLSVVLFGCTDQLTQSPSNQLPASEAITSVGDLQSAVNGVYATLVNDMSYCGNFGLYADAKGGELEYLNNYGHLGPVINLQTDKNSDEAAGFFSTFYVAIYRINDIIAALKAKPLAEASTPQYKDLMGQLHAMRALYHFELLRIYCPLPAVATDMNAAKSGIVISDKTHKSNTTFTRNTLKESYDFVITEFNESLKTIGKAKSIGSLNYWAVQGLLSRVYLYLERYQEALDAAKDVITNSPYALYTIANYMESWKIEGASEVLFEVRTSDLDNAQRNSIGYYTSPDGYPEGTASASFKQFYDALPAGDVRKGVLAKEISTDNKFEAFYCQKYKGRAGVTSPLYVNNPRVIRLSEVYYIAAEAVLKGATGGQTAAFYLNEVKKNRITGYVDMATVTIDDILADRRIELYCENARMFDLVRYKKVINHHGFANPIQPTDTRLLVSWPQRELEINKNF